MKFLTEKELQEFKGVTGPEPILSYAPNMLQKDPKGLNAKDPGAKLDAGKSPVFRGLLDYFPRACLAVADISAQGAAKYSWRGWEKVEDGVNRYSDAMVRHIVNSSIEGDYDPEGFLHRAQIAWNALASLELYLREKKNV